MVHQEIVSYEGTGT